MELSDVQERIVAAKDVMRRVEVRSPQEGIVANIRLRTPGGVIAPGEAIMDIVPENEPLVVEMKISPRDIDSISVGASAQIRLTAYNQRTMAPLDGKLTYIAADQSLDEKPIRHFSWPARKSLQPLSPQIPPPGFIPECLPKSSSCTRNAGPSTISSRRLRTVSTVPSAKINMKSISQ